MTNKPNGNSNNGNSPHPPKSVGANEASGSTPLAAAGPTDSSGPETSKCAPSPAGSSHDGTGDEFAAGGKHHASANATGDKMNTSIRNKKGQFKPGYSGHPAGRTPKQKPTPMQRQSIREITYHMLTEPIGIVLGEGERGEVQAIHAVLLKMRNLALGGCTKAAKLVFDTIQRFELRDAIFLPPEPSPADLAYLAEVRQSAEEWARPKPGDPDYDEGLSRPNNNSKPTSNHLDDDPSIAIIDPGNGKPS